MYSSQLLRDFDIEITKGDIYETSKFNQFNICNLKDAEFTIKSKSYRNPNNNLILFGLKTTIYDYRIKNIALPQLDKKHKNVQFQVIIKYLETHYIKMLETPKSTGLMTYILSSMILDLLNNPEYENIYFQIDLTERIDLVPKEYITRVYARLLPNKENLSPDLIRRYKVFSPSKRKEDIIYYTNLMINNRYKFLKNYYNNQVIAKSNYQNK
ncbi:hypothetical protein [Macrococcoides bohemicum]|uniref:hypothetical protein n=1 Tax=Macrococcoides bohemicum TaxID=1903056 RepID=UPI00165D77DF|nr:hypothetical protein [Macrococcus bohemicus]MBC9875543.1 hypothetical protein [Macrococcus bohemicus]